MKNLAAQRPRRFPAHIRSILVLILVLALLLGFTVQMVRSAKLQTDAVAAIASAGGNAYYDQGYRPKSLLFVPCEAIRRWSSDRIGPDYFYRVYEVSANCRNSDGVMEQVEHLDGLRCLRLGGQGVSDKSLCRLSGLAHLELLTLDRTRVSDEGAKNLAALRCLTRLSLCTTRITDAGLRHLGILAQLRALFLSETIVSDEGMVEVGKLSYLELLDVSGSRVTDQGLKHLSGLGRLRALNLSSTGVTDSGLTEIDKLKSLEMLDLRGTRVTSAGVSRLRRSLPKALILDGQALRFPVPLYGGSSRWPSP